MAHRLPRILRMLLDMLLPRATPLEGGVGIGVVHLSPPLVREAASTDDIC